MIQSYTRPLSHLCIILFLLKIIHVSHRFFIANFCFMSSPVFFFLFPSVFFGFLPTIFILLGQPLSFNLCLTLLFAHFCSHRELGTVHNCINSNNIGQITCFVMNIFLVWQGILLFYCRQELAIGECVT